MSWAPARSPLGPRLFYANSPQNPQGDSSLHFLFWAHFEFVALVYPCWVFMSVSFLRLWPPVHLSLSNSHHLIWKKEKKSWVEAEDNGTPAVDRLDWPWLFDIGNFSNSCDCHTTAKVSGFSCNENWQLCPRTGDSVSRDPGWPWNKLRSTQHGGWVGVQFWT